MKVLHLTTHLNSGGISSYILELVKPLTQIGAEIHIASSGGELTPLFEAAGAKIHRLNIRTKSELHPKLYLTLKPLIRLVREHQIELIHAHTRVTQVLARWVSRFTGVAVVTTCHGFYKRKLGRILNPSWGDRVIAISETVKRYLQKEFKVPEERIRTVYNAIDIFAFARKFRRHDPIQARHVYGFLKDDFVLCVTARLVKEKGQEYLLRAFAELLPSFPNLRLLIVGQGREDFNLKNLAKKFKLGETVCFTGSVRDVTRPLSACDVAVHSAIWQEAFGLSIVEAMVVGKPSIVTTSWALYDSLKEEQIALFVEPANIQQLAEAIKTLLQNPELCATMGQNAKKIARERFSADRMAREIYEVYAELLQTASQ